MEVILDMPKDFVDYLKSFNFDVFYNLQDRNVHVIIEPSNARELQRLGEVIEQEEV